MPLQAGFDLEQVGIAPFATLTTQPGLLGGKVHGSLARAGKVKGQTPKVDAEEKKKAKTGRAKRRMQVSRIYRLSRDNCIVNNEWIFLNHFCLLFLSIHLSNILLGSFYPTSRNNCNYFC